MALIKRDGHGQIELNKVAFRRDGRVEAQLPFAGASGNTCENGMILEVGPTSVAYATVAGTSAGADGKLYGLVYTSEELYDERKPGLKNFYFEVNADGVVEGPEGYDVLPRLGYLAEGDVFTTNAVDMATVTETGTKLIGKFGGVGTAGNIVMSVSAPVGGPVLQVKEDTTMPDGQRAIKFVVVRA